MQSREKYKDLTHALKKFRGQVSESIPYAIENFPRLDTPEKIFNYLKVRTTYKNDPKGVELFQTLPTLFDNNRHGTPGAGDCDCFTIAALATLIANGFTNVGIVLAGRNSLCAKHIYAYVDEPGKQRQFLDLTNKVFNYERYYPFKQHIPYKLNQEEKNMILELADGPTSRGHAPHPYIHFPNKGIQVREDYFDNMSAGEFQQMCLSEGIPIEELEELSGRRAQRRAEKDVRKAKKKAAKPRNQRKMIKAQAKAEKKRDQGKASKMRAQARIDKANNPPPSSGYAPAPEDETELPEGSEGDYENEEEETEFDQQVEEMFLGETEIAGMSVSKKLLWGLGLASLGYLAGRQLKKGKMRRAA